MACFADINVSQGSVATYARCGGIFNMHLTENLPRNLPVEKFCKSVKIWQNYGHESWPRFLAHPVYSKMISSIVTIKLDVVSGSVQGTACRVTDDFVYRDRKTHAHNRLLHFDHAAIGKNLRVDTKTIKWQNKVRVNTRVYRPLTRVSFWSVVQPVVRMSALYSRFYDWLDETF